MKRKGTWRMRAGVAAAALLCALSPRAVAQSNGVIRGQILDIEGKPWANLTVQVVADQGSKAEAKTDEKGNFIVGGLKHGVYTVNVVIPDQPQPSSMAKVNVTGESDTVVDLNFKEIVAKQNPGYAEAVKKQEEEKKKFESVKAHFTTGSSLLEQMRQVKNDLTKAPADQRAALKQKLADLSNQAATEFQAAQQGAGEKDTNQPLFWAKLGEVYDLAGRNDEAINAYQQAVKLKPDAGHYNNLGNVLAKAGKIDEAKEAYMKSAELDPAHAVQAWKNFGIVLYNSGQYKAALEPLQKAVDLEPKNPQSWYLLGACKVGAMDFKKEGDKDVPIILPGTIEAYEKAAELDPDGPWGKQAREGLDQLKAIAPGIQTSIGAKKKKKS